MAGSPLTTGFLVRPEDVHDEYFELRGDEAAHATRVLRVRPGQSISAVDGAGKRYGGTIVRVGDGVVVAHLDSTMSGVGETGYDLQIVFGNIKSRNRLELLVEKSVELGVSSLTVVQTARSVKFGLAAGRLERIVRAATKQSNRSCFMAISGPRTFAEALERDSQEQRALIVCHEKAAAESTLASALRSAGHPRRLSVWVGPEGGFTDLEIAALVSAGASVASLGPTRLRAETAGIAVGAGVNLLLAGASTEPS